MSNLLWPTDYSTPGLHVPHQLPKFAQVHVHCIGDANQPSHPLMPSSPWLLIFPSIRDFPMSQLFASKYWSFSFNISPSNEYSGLISLKIDWFDLLKSKGLSRVFSNTTIWKHQFFSSQPTQGPTLTSGKNIALTIWTFVGRAMTLLFSTLSRFVRAFLPRSKHLLISWLHSPSIMILEPKNRKSVTISTFSPLYLSWSNGAEWHDLSFSNI